MIDTLVGLLSDVGIRLKSYRAGSQQNSLICPRCNGGSHKERSLNVRVDDDGEGATWHCHRGTCDWRDNVRLARTKAPPQRKPQPKPIPDHAPWERSDCPVWLYEFFEERRIGKRTVDAFGIYAKDRWFARGNAERPAIVFPYRHDGTVHSRKYRAHPAKDYSLEAGKPTLFNADSLVNAETVAFVEGETDVMALVECGATHVVSLRDGASDNLDALETHADELAKVKRFVLAGDMDKPGLDWRERLARRLGRHKCSIVTWPEGCKDACDTLRAGTSEAVRTAIKAAEPYPIEGVHRVKRGMLEALRRKGPRSTMTTGTWTSDQVFKFPADGALITITGIPNHGKSTWLRFVMMHTAREHARKWLVFTPEHDFEHFISECSEVYAGKSFWPHGNLSSMTAEEQEQAEAFMEDRVWVMQCDNEAESPTIDWLLERAAFCILRDGVTDVVIDPWNEIEHVRGNLNETEYTSRVLGRFKSFIRRHGCNIWVVVHPTKPQGVKPGEKRDAPLGYDTSGSAHHFNKPDIGLTVHSNAPGEVDVIMWKSRHSRLWGKRGSTARLDYDQSCGRYRDPINTDASEPPPDPRFTD